MSPTKLTTHNFHIWIGGKPDAPSVSSQPCTQPYHASVFNISALSFGSLSANAIRALNMGNMDKQHKVFKDYWPMADANSFRAENKSLPPA